MKQTLKNTIEYCGLTYKTEKTKIILINLLGVILTVVAYLLTKDIKITGIAFALPLTLDYLIVTSYSSKKKKIDESRDKEFITIISYFEIFVTNRNNVYQSFNKVIPYCSDWMKEVILRMLRSIDTDKSVRPYIDFATCFKNNIATNIMLSIYQMVDQGESFEQINQFQVLFEQLQKSNIIELVEKKKRSLSSLASLPLVGAAGITIILTISVISIIGDLINVI